jgi:hypothetical protein
VVSADIQVYESKIRSQVLEARSKRIGTSKEYRVPDGKDGGRSDPEELVSNWTPNAGSLEVTHEHPYLKAIGSPLQPGTKLTLNFEEGVKFRLNANAYVFSTSGEYTEELAERMASEFDAEACVRISDPKAFCDALISIPIFRGERAYMDYVKYGETNASADFQPINAFWKLNQFAWQRELRIVIACQEDAQPVVVEVPEITPLLSRVR